MRFYHFLFIFIFVLSSNAFSCGEYLLHAKVDMQNGAFYLVIYPQSQSEMSLQASFNESPKLAPYNERFIEAIVTITKAVNSDKKEISKIESIKVLVPDPMAPGKGTSMKLLKNENCYKK